MRKDKNITHDEGSCPENRSGKANVFAFIVCILLAVIIWLYVVNKDPNNNIPNDPPHNDSYQGEVTE